MAVSARAGRPVLSDVNAVALATAFGPLTSNLPADRADLALEVSHPGLARVAVDDEQQRLVAELDPRRRQAVALDLARDQVALGDLQFLLLRVAGELDHLHA